MSLTSEDAARLGGSDMAALLGLSPWATPLSVYARVVSALEGRYVEAPSTGFRRRGQVLESAVLRLYAEETGREVFPAASLRCPSPWLRASLDARSLGDMPGIRVVDAKTQGRVGMLLWGEPGTDHVPQYILFQQVFYTGVGLWSGEVDEPVADVAALVAGDLAVYHVPHDAELYEMLLATAERFWKDHVLPRKPPPLTEPLKDLDALSTLYPKHEGEAKDWGALTTPEQTAVRQWLTARACRMQWAKEEAVYEARLKSILESRPQLVGLPDELPSRIDWKQNKPSEVTDWEAVARDLYESADVSPKAYKEIIKANTTTKPGARPLRVIERKGEP